MTRPPRWAWAALFAAGYAVVFASAYQLGKRAAPARVETREATTDAKAKLSAQGTAASVSSSQASAQLTDDEWEDVVATVFDCPSGKPSATTHTKRRRQVAAKLDEKRDDKHNETLGLSLDTAVRIVEKEKLVLRAPELPRWSVGVGAGMRLDGERRYDLRVERRVLGPWWLGAYVRSDKSAGLSLRVEW